MSINDDFQSRNSSNNLKQGQLIVPQSMRDTQDNSNNPTFGKNGQLKTVILDDSLFDKLKRNKTLVGIVVAILFFLILLIAICSKKSNTPIPPGPHPPTPTGDDWNPYLVQDIYKYDSSKVFGSIKFNNNFQNNLQGSFLHSQQNKIRAYPRQIPVGENNKMATIAQFEIGQIDRKTARIEISPVMGRRYEPPADVVQKLKIDPFMRVEMGGLKVYNDPFGFEFTDPSRNNDVILHTNGSTLVVMDKYLQIDLNLPTRQIYGLGERKSNFTIGEGAWTMWATGEEKEFDDGKTGSGNSYGVHPFALVQTKTVGEYIGLFFRNTNAQSIVINDKDRTESIMTYITTGGKIEIYVMLRGSAKEVVRRYHEIIGKPNLPPLWALGWHFESAKFKTETDVETTIEDYLENNFPLESVFLDIEYMDDGQDFTIDTQAFPNLKTMVSNLHNKQIKIVPRFDLGISAYNKSGDMFYQANYSNSLIKTTINNKPDAQYLESKVHSKQTVYFDFFSDTSIGIWGTGLDKTWVENMNYDGIWLSNNEATTICDGECPNDSNNLHHSSLFQSFLREDMTSSANSWFFKYNNQNEKSTYYLPFTPGNQNLDKHTLSLNATHPTNNFTQFDTHNLNGHLQCRASFQEMQLMDNFADGRLFIMSRSTFAGSGKYAGHYFEDKIKNFDDLKNVVTQAMNFNMFGIPLSGPNICSQAKKDKESQELCLRQVQLASFLPFARISLGNASDSVEMYKFDYDIKKLIVQAMNDKLRFSRLLYGCLFEANQKGETCIDPLFFHFVDVKDAYKNQSDEFIFANALKITPVYQHEQKIAKSFFSKGMWVNMHDFSDIKVVREEIGEWIDLKTETSINAWQMPGTVIPYLPNDKKFKNTHDITLNGDIHILINRDFEGYAEGKLFFDTGIYKHEITNSSYESYVIQHSGKSIKRWNKNESPEEGKSGTFKLDKIVILNAGDIKDTDFACARDIRSAEIVGLLAKYDPKQQTLTIAPSGGALVMTELAAIYYGNKDADMNICDPTPQYYKFVKGTPDISQHNASAELQSDYGDHQNVVLNMNVKEGGILNLNWNFRNHDFAQRQYEVPKQVVPGLKNDEKEKLSDFMSFSQQANGQFYIDVKNKETGAKIYRLTGFLLDRFLSLIQADVYVNKNNFKGIMGLSDQVRNDIFLEDGVYTLWNRNSKGPKADGILPGKNMWGSSPFYMGKAEDQQNSWFGVYHNSVAASDWWIFNDEQNGKVSIDTYAVGGIGDLYFMFGKTPDEVIKKYQTLIGKPALQPQWALGWHQSKFGYNNTHDMRDSVVKYFNFELPLDALWADIDIMENFKVFTVDQRKFGDIKRFTDEIHGLGVKFVPIVDAGIALRPDENYLPYEEGIKKDVFIKSPTDDDDPFVGNGWPVETVYPDWSAAEADYYWSEMLGIFRSKINFDGIWLENNEVESFCDGPCRLSQIAFTPVQNFLTYIPGGRSLEEQTISLDATHQNRFMQLDTHNLYGTLQSRATRLFFNSQINQQERGFVISRSGSQGIGTFGARQLGNNFSTFDNLSSSIISIFQQSIAGVSMSGVDICGYFGNVTDDLCAHWYSIGAFYPFSRNHNNIENSEQEPWHFQDDHIKVIRQSMYNKLSLIRYYHTEMIKTHIEGGTFFKPLFFEFPDDEGAYLGQTFNAMVGSSLKLAFNSQELTDLSKFYYPEGTWCNIITTANYSVDCINADKSQNISSSSHLGDVYADLREGRIIPFQNVTYMIKQQHKKINNTHNLKYESTDFLILPNCNGSICAAEGDFYNDNDTAAILTDEINKYKLTYEHDFINNPNEFSLNVTTLELAKAHENNVINQNDALGVIKILNARNVHIDKNVEYKIEAVFNDDSKKQLKNSVFDDHINVLSSQENPHLEPLWLSYIKSFKFTKIV